ncbi:MAG: hypothetical protein ACTS7D_01760 [Candidatus Hodgkinia cicadicola]
METTFARWNQAKEAQINLYERSVRTKHFVQLTTVRNGIKRKLKLLLERNADFENQTRETN